MMSSHFPGLTPALQNPNSTFTVLVPTNEAFKNVTQVNASDIDSLRTVSPSLAG